MVEINSMYAQVTKIRNSKKTDNKSMYKKAYIKKLDKYIIKTLPKLENPRYTEYEILKIIETMMNRIHEAHLYLETGKDEYNIIYIQEINEENKIFDDYEKMLYFYNYGYVMEKETPESIKVLFDVTVGDIYYLYDNFHRIENNLPKEYKMRVESALSHLEELKIQLGAMKYLGIE